MSHTLNIRSDVWEKLVRLLFRLFLSWGGGDGLRITLHLYVIVSCLVTFDINVTHRIEMWRGLVPRSRFKWLDRKRQSARLGRDPAIVASGEVIG